MKEDFKRTTVVCAAVVTFLGGAYAGGSILVEAFTSAVRTANERIDSSVQGVPDASGEDSKASASIQSVIPKKFGFSIER